MTLRDFSNPNDAQVREALIRSELKALTEEQETMNKHRAYFDGEQALTYNTQSFIDTFGGAMSGFKDNWCEVVVNAVNDKLQLKGFHLGTTTEDPSEFDEEISTRIWDQFILNDIDEQQIDHHEGILVENRAFIIVWPEDGSDDVLIDWQPGQLCRVFYDPDRRRQALWAVKRWQTDFGDVFVTFYTPEAVFKFLDTSGNFNQAQDRSGSSPSALTEIPGVGWVSGLEKREVEGEDWPLQNSLGVVPVIEFNNTSYRSEIKHTVPQQDSINKMLVDMMVASSFMASPQKYAETLANEPEGGWNMGPNELMHFLPSMDSEGKPIRTQFGTFDAHDPSNFRDPVQLMLAHVAHTSSTPVRYFMQSDRGGRGDAPSGESLLVDDKPLNDKVEKKQTRFGNRWIDVVRLVARALSIDDAENLRGEPIWRDPRYDYRLTVIEEASGLVEMGIPLKFAIKKLGLRDDEITMIEEMLEAEKAEEAEQAEQDQANAMAIQEASTPEPSAPPNN